MSAPAFTLDTSGAVWTPQDSATRRLVTWRDLSPFAQGYIEALFAGDIYHHEGILIYDKKLPFHTRGWAFSDLAPETLARIIADCEKCITLYKFETADDGRTFWTERQTAPGHDATLFREAFASVFPPLNVQLGDDGKVRFA